MAAPRILVTRAPHQASALADGLRVAGMEPILIPTIELAPPSQLEALPRAIAAIENFDWLLFTSANAVEAFAKIVRSAPMNFSSEGYQTPTSLSLPRGLRIAAIGPATSRALTAVGLAAHLLPEHAVAESFEEALLPHARHLDGTPARFLLVRAETARDHLPESLRAAGAEVTIAPAYRTVVPAGSVEQLRALFARAENYPAAITFTSSSTATNLLDLLSSAGLALPPQIIRASIGPITTQTLVDAGLPPHTEAVEATVASLVEALIRALMLDR
jgi:uroporphyrinogen-III synthase